MTRLLKLAVILFSIFSFASAQLVQTLNTPSGPVSQGANVPVTWSLVNGADATGKNGALTAQDTTSKNTTTIDPAVPLAPMSYTWNVAVPPGTYTLGLNDGSGVKQSGEVVVQAGGAAAPAPAPAAPAPNGGPAPAGGAPPPGGKSAPAPGGKSAPAPAASPASDSPAVIPPAQVSGNVSPSSSSAASSPSSASSPATTASSASSIFSGYGVVFSLLSVAIVMLQF